MSRRKVVNFIRQLSCESSPIPAVAELLRLYTADHEVVGRKFGWAQLYRWCRVAARCLISDVWSLSHALLPVIMAL